ncbi:hypothetical protein BU26DRAFT_322731 [Trematosphaeria pertusa]|uniref:Uncharacterized protein n=1 Tax=Trematosphaeria pertusa TaxID=390896 RepID=A0A6A6IEA7_9PLEO|nr:uncharacterized protein BU26DRAFT_322731 [Trematosphaeria pertusa]KAF2247900.1 hypothetical protein BU26DRAFT_322731 [Trematosphaeria pertusa]
MMQNVHRATCRSESYILLLRLSFWRLHMNKTRTLVGLSRHLLPATRLLSASLCLFFCGSEFSLQPYSHHPVWRLSNQSCDTKVNATHSN